MWPHSSQTYEPGRCNSGRNSSPATQYGQRTNFSVILSLPLFRRSHRAFVAITFSRSLTVHNYAVRPHHAARLRPVSRSQGWQEH